MVIDIGNTDWPLLRKQKELLLKITEPYCKPEHEFYDLTGLVHWIDNIQDEAVMTGAATEFDVFGISMDDILEEYNRVISMMDDKTLMDMLDSYMSDSEKRDLVKQHHVEDEEYNQWKQL